MKRLIWAGFAAGVVAASVLLILAAAPAGAQGLSGFSGCSATFDGIDIRNYDTPKRAKVVSENARMGVTGTALDVFFTQEDTRDLAYLVKLELAGASWTVDSGVTSQQTWSGTVDIKKYAKRGTGIYKVVAVTRGNSGQECFGRAYVKVKSGSPLDSTAGQVAAGAGALGLGGMAVAAARAGAEITPEVVEEKTMDWLEKQAGGEPPEETPLADEKAEAMRELNRRYDAELELAKFCGAMTIVAAAATIKAVASDAGHHVAAMIGGWWR